MRRADGMHCFASSRYETAETHRAAPFLQPHRRGTVGPALARVRPNFSSLIPVACADVQQVSGVSRVEAAAGDGGGYDKIDSVRLARGPPRQAAAGSAPVLAMANFWWIGRFLIPAVSRHRH